ncbi:trem-like transcript 4 protein [Meriones unguiculatus]|uniref:trem-like transcript 4 protein n=1 Tax=Meriones unguiculatus TaxID=10047 RepID=UPI000B4F6D95|nr:trem-like transcript 4 protein [Meriones unguiculatus]XP_021492965.1 trem-like transcript 4 protein isoform X1 [Meriones unguiculatus]XP_021492966.1 trem-like transcript 4 protein isoform X1 [Meriones unguiculatus]XP_021492967.1 trem-like transcript 4 protein isoform X1 [Meriones unguiculatus]XP_021492968.1 trem-like transcript 4 protein isoform X1 [Meriones unguiculatus]
MAWRCSQLLLAPVLLVFLASGVWGAAVSEEVRRVVGQNLSVQCQYKPEAGPYVQKTWCQQTAPTRCNRVVTTSEPRKADKASQSTIWDDPEAGFFSITMTHLTEKDSAFYWCGPYNPSRNEMNVLRNISLVVSPASTPPQMTTWFPTSTASTPPQMTTWFPTSTVLTALPEETTGSSINGSEYRNQSSPSSPCWTSTSLLLSVQCGLLLLKGLLLSVFCVVICRRRCQGQEYRAEAVKMEVSEYASFSAVRKSSGYGKNDYTQ